MANVTLEQLEHVFRSCNEFQFPMLKERVDVLRVRFIFVFSDDICARELP